MVNSIPTTIKIAAWIWLSFGVMILLGFISIAIISLTTKTEFSFFMLLLFIPLFVAIAIIRIGRKTLIGKADDTLGNGIGSIVFGLLPMLDSLKKISAGESISATAFIAVLLLIAGILALIGRQEYLEG